MEVLGGDEEEHAALLACYLLPRVRRVPRAQYVLCSLQHVHIDIYEGSSKSFEPNILTYILSKSFCYSKI